MKPKGRGKERAKYGNELIKKWSKILVERYGKGYIYLNLQKFKQFYNKFPIVDALHQQFISWTHIRHLLPIKDENERNLSRNDLRKVIKNQEYELV